MFGNMAQNFGRVDYLMSLPIILLTLFALGILLVDLMLPTQWKWTNALTAMVGILFSTAGVIKIQHAFSVARLPGESAFLNSMVVDHFTIYFWYLFLASAAIAILSSVRYLEIEHEHHGEFYSLILFSVVGMMCMAAAFDVSKMSDSAYPPTTIRCETRCDSSAARRIAAIGAEEMPMMASRLISRWSRTASRSA